MKQEHSVVPFLMARKREPGQRQHEWDKRIPWLRHPCVVSTLQWTLAMTVMRDARRCGEEKMWPRTGDSDLLKRVAQVRGKVEGRPVHLHESLAAHKFRVVR